MSTAECCYNVGSSRRDYRGLYELMVVTRGLDTEFVNLKRQVSWRCSRFVVVRQLRR
ncbi:hypothetical protein [Mycobacterium leprae]|uniref:hypothetical protein n=1 Tax=Mycobacterium leprae TaxID=1769 RepID=UPI0002D3A4DC|nr:hypothetical protein [Mycobacterium leprae]